MSASVGLERGYRRLLAAYPRAFWCEHEGEMLAVLMAGAQDGQRRPSLAEVVDVLRSALRMRLWPARPRPGTGAWADSLAVFSLAAPLFLLVVDILAVALPYRPTAWRHAFIPPPEIGGLSLISAHLFVITVGCEVILATFVLLGLRFAALLPIAGSVAYWAVAPQGIPGISYPLQLLTTCVYLLVVVALLASPGPRHGRHLMNWGHWAALLLIAGAVQALALWYAATSPFAGFGARGTTVYLVLSIVLALAAVTAAGVMRVSWQFLLLIATACYPFAAELAFSGSSSSGDLLGSPTPWHLAVLFVPPLLVACAAVISAVTGSRSPSPEPGEPGLA